MLSGSVAADRRGYRAFFLTLWSGGVSVRLVCLLSALVLSSVGGCTSKSSVDSSRALAESEVQLPPRSRLSVSTKGAAIDTASVSAAAGKSTGFGATFLDVHAESGIDFAYANGAVGRAMMVEVTGGGAGWLDYDADGQWDLYLAQGGNPAWTSPTENAPDALYRQIGAGQFEEIAGPARIDERGYGQGVAVGDFDNDGFDDIYVSNVGRNSFFQNLGDGTFRELADAARVQDSRWSSSAAWADLDADGDLDLYLCNYVIYDPYHPYPCYLKDGTPATCHPEELNPVPNVCFENLGDGTFNEVSTAWGLVGQGSKSLGVVVADMDGDRQSDIYIANDMTTNFFYRCVGPGVFHEEGAGKGCALSGDGLFQASMGVAIGDYDDNGFLDLYVTHFTDDSNTLYTNLGSVGFQDSTQALGLHVPTLKYLGFGTVMADFDRDRKQELFVANGHIDDRTAAGYLFEMPAQLFTYREGRFVECSQEAGPYFQQQVVGRSVATCDWDDDGDLDLAVTHQNRAAALLRNECDSGHWLKVRLVGTTSNRRGINTKLELRQGARRHVQELVAGSSYCATHEPCVFFGLGDDAAELKLELWWPSGIHQAVDGIAVDQTVTVREPGSDFALSSLKPVPASEESSP